MHTLVPAIFTILVLSFIVRLILRLIWNPYGLRRPYYGPYGIYGYGHRYRRHLFPGRGLITILFLVTLDRLFRNRW